MSHQHVGLNKELEVVDDIGTNRKIQKDDRKIV